MTTLTNAMKSPPAIGGTTPAAGYFTELQASSSVSGTGFSTLFASPYVIGNGTPAAGTFTTLRATTHINYRGGDNASATNSGFGEGALDSNSGGLYNSAFGQSALTANTSGNGNTAFGYTALSSCVSGLQNTAVGKDALANVTLHFNTAVGYQSLNNCSTGAANTAVGDQTMSALTTANSNTAIGQSAGASITDQAGNVCIGASSGPTTNAIAASISIGAGAQTTKSYQAVIGDINITEYFLQGTASYLKFAGGASTAAPRTVTAATDTIDAGSAIDSSIIANRAGTVTLTLPAAASYAGRWLYVRTIQSQTVVSASSNVVPSVGGAAGTAILAGTAGKWAALQSDGTNWQVMMAN